MTVVKMSDYIFQELRFGKYINEHVFAIKLSFYKCRICLNSDDTTMQAKGALWKNKNVFLFQKSENKKKRSSQCQKPSNSINYSQF